MESKIFFIVQIVLLIVLLYGVYTVTATGKMSNFTKWLIVGSATAIFIISDKVFGVVTVLIVLGIKAFKHKNNGLEQP